MPETFEIVLSGRVQGVGFRPFVYNLAQEFDLKGTVCNNEKGVLIQLNASDEEARQFMEALLAKAPEVSKVTQSSLEKIPSVKYSEFRIVPSDSSAPIDVPLTPDFAICESCKAELRDPKNRRFGYPFTTCTRCGPRYAITVKFPFERSHTAMDAFPMCAACQSEYEEPTDRRFHSQTNTCHDCGIPLRLTDARGANLNSDQNEIIREAAEFILAGSIVAMKNTNGYLLCCDARNSTAIAKLREKKRRPSKPFALLYPSVEKAKADFFMSKAEEDALLSTVAPIVVLKPKSASHLSLSQIAPGLNHIGLMLPSSALLTLLMDELKIPIVATSGNIHGSPIVSEEEEAMKNLSSVADYFVHHDLTITFPQDDSVVKFAGNQPITLRRSRGLSPNYGGMQSSRSEKVMAMGAHLKSTFGFAPNSHIYVSPYFGNLDNYDVLRRYKRTISRYQELFGSEVDTVLIDRHPQYQSSILGRELAEEKNAAVRAIQHHKAHFAAVLGEHNLFESTEKILGVIWDGTGMGDDGAIWGGEFFSYENFHIRRINHFDYFDSIAGEKMAKEPRLCLLCALSDNQRETARHKFSNGEWKIYAKVLESNTLKTSSVGRLFDAVASLLELIDVASYEGEAAMLLEACAEGYGGGESIDFLKDVEVQKVPTKNLMTAILSAFEDGTPKEKIADGFIFTLAQCVVKIARKNGFNCIACSGGVFQNVVLVKKLIELTKASKIEIKLNSTLSCNDENISFGQLCFHRYLKN